MNLLNNLRLRHAGLILAATRDARRRRASAQTTIKFSLDFKFEGPAAPFLVAIDKGYFKAEGLDVTIDTGGGSLEPINRVASGTYDMGFGDINSLIKFRDANPTRRSRPCSWSTTSRRSRSSAARAAASTEPKDLEGKKLGAPGAGRRLCAVEDLRRRPTASTPPR